VPAAVALVLPSIGLAAVRIDAATQAETGIVERRHAALNGVYDPFWRD